MTALRAVRSKEPYVAAVAVGIVGAFSALAVHTLVDHLSSHTNLTLVWLFAGLAAALGAVKTDQRTDDIVGD